MAPDEEAGYESPLSSIDSPEPYASDAEDTAVYETTLRDKSYPPSKRRKVDSAASSAIIPEPDADIHAHDDPTLEGLSDISSDTSGDIPSSPAGARLEEEDYIEQVTRCRWDGCDVGDLGNMDRLVEHIHNSHIENRQKNYTCEWLSCARKGMQHASGYALKAHMRSHTREKPFHCYLPECDRSFTRSDALAKHMRTVHETEALRPSDPVPKSMQPTGKNKLKIIIKTSQSQPLGQDDPDDSTTPEESAEFFTPLPEELFDPDELSHPVDKLYRKCHWEAKWAEEIGDSLKKECEEWEQRYHSEWLEKEVLLTQVIQSEVDWHERRQAILSGAANVEVASAMDVSQEHKAKDDDDAETREVSPATSGIDKVEPMAVEA